MRTSLQLHMVILDKKGLFPFEEFLEPIHKAQRLMLDNICLFSKPRNLIASSNLRAPSASTSAVYSGASNETATWLCAARLYISSGLTSLIILVKFEESVKSP